MSPIVVSITPEESAALAARLLSRHNLGALPVCGEGGALCGIVTDRDIVTRCVATGQDPGRVPVGEIMTQHPETAAPEEGALSAARKMACCQVRRLPVVEGGHVVGMVSLGDLSKCSACNTEAGEALTEISQNVRSGGVR